jgi:hypothetical protein
VHDFFQILGVSDAAPAHELRRALRRRPARSHPDFHHGAAAPLAPDDRALDDVAIDFIDMHPIVDRMQAAFFRDIET